MRSLYVAYAPLVIFFVASVSSDCNRGFEEHDRPLVSVITKETVRRGDYVFPFWVDENVSGGNFVVDRSDRTCIVVPATGTYAIVVILDGVRASRVRVFSQQGSITDRTLATHVLNPSGTSIGGSVSYLKVNERLTFEIEGSQSTTSTSSIQLFAYLINLSA